MIRCKDTESLPQAGNRKTINVREHTCKENWDGLYSRDTVSNKYHQHGHIKGTHHEQSTRKINVQEKTVTVCLLIALTHHLKGLYYISFFILHRSDRKSVV